MSKVTIYRFSLYDIQSDEFVASRRWGTLDAIAKVNGQVDEASAFETDETSIFLDAVGFTEIGFIPPAAAVVCSVLADSFRAKGIGS